MLVLPRRAATVAFALEQLFMFGHPLHMTESHFGDQAAGVEVIGTRQQPKAVDHQVPGITSGALVVEGADVAGDQGSVLAIRQVYPHGAATQYRSCGVTQAIKLDVVGVNVAGESRRHLQAPRVVIIELAVVQADFRVQIVEAVGTHHAPVALVLGLERIDQWPCDTAEQRQAVRPLQGNVGGGQIRAAFRRASGVPFEEILRRQRQLVGDLRLGGNLRQRQEDFARLGAGVTHGLAPIQRCL
ncbi:hypothetical protein D3C80_1164850 [compost metagenome]